LNHRKKKKKKQNIYTLKKTRVLPRRNIPHPPLDMKLEIGLKISNSLSDLKHTLQICCDSVCFSTNTLRSTPKRDENHIVTRTRRMKNARTRRTVDVFVLSTRRDQQKEGLIVMEI
jgi:hypothetical protein